MGTLLGDRIFKTHIETDGLPEDVLNLAICLYKKHSKEGMSVPAGLSINEPPLRWGVSAGEVAQCLPDMCEALESVPAPQKLDAVKEHSYNPSPREAEDETPTYSHSYTATGRPTRATGALPGGEVGSRAKPLPPGDTTSWMKGWVDRESPPEQDIPARLIQATQELNSSS